jgi:hypothetical protein
MPHNPEDVAEARRALEDWIRDRPNGSIVVASIDEQADGALDIGLRLSALTGYHLIGLIQALVGHTLTVLEQSPVATASRDYETLCYIKALLDGGRPLIN